MNFKNFILPALTIILWGFGITSDTLAIWLEQQLTYRQLLATCLAIILLLLGTVYVLSRQIYALNKKQSKAQQLIEKLQANPPPTLLTPQDGILFDSQGNAYCPICQTLMSHTSPYGYDPNSWYCPKCNKTFFTGKDGNIDSMLPFTV